MRNNEGMVSEMTLSEAGITNSWQYDMVYHLDMWHECLAYGKYEEAEMHRKGYEEAKREWKKMKGVK